MLLYVCMTLGLEVLRWVLAALAHRGHSVGQWVCAARCALVPVTFLPGTPPSPRGRHRAWKLYAKGPGGDVDQRQPITVAPWRAQPPRVPPHAGKAEPLGWFEMP